MTDRKEFWKRAARARRAAALGDELRWLLTELESEASTCDDKPEMYAACEALISQMWALLLAQPIDADAIIEACGEPRL